MKLHGTVLIESPRADVWELFMDPIQLAKVVPGCEKVQRIDDTHYDAVMAVKVQFMTIRSKAHGVILPSDTPYHLNAELIGEPIAMAGAFNAQLSLDLEEVNERSTQMMYSIQLSLLGRLASLGEAIVRSTSQRLSAQFAENVVQLFDASRKP